MIGERRAEILAADGIRSTSLVLEEQQAFLPLTVEFAMPDVVEDVERAASQGALQGVQCRLFQPCDVHGSVGHEPRERAVDVLDLTFDVELGHAVRAADHTEDSQWP